MAIKASSTTTTSDVSEQIAVLQNDLATLTKAISELTKDKGAQLSDTARLKVADAQQTAMDQIDTAKARADKLQGQASDFIREQPAMALGIAAGVGFLLGTLGNRK